MIVPTLVPFFALVSSFMSPSPCQDETVTEADPYVRVIDLPADEYVQRMFERKGTVYAEIRAPGGDRDMALHRVDFRTVTADSPPDAGGPATSLPPEEGGDSVTKSPCGFDWLTTIKDPPGGSMHISSSEDGCIALLVSRGAEIDSEGSVYLFKNSGGSKMRLFDGLIQATLSLDGDAVLVQTTAELRFYWTRNFLEDGKYIVRSVTGEDRHVGDVDQGQVEHVEGAEGLFILKKKLSVELYSTLVDVVGSLPDSATSLVSFFVETQTYAVHTEYDPVSRLFVVAERGRVRVARLDENYAATFLMDQKIAPRSGFEIRSCKLDRSSARRQDGAQVRLAIGLRKNVKNPKKGEPGSCEVQFQLLLAKEALEVQSFKSWTTEVEPQTESSKENLKADVLFESAWEPAKRFRADSPQVFFGRAGALLFTATRDQIWRYEVAQ